MHNSSNIQSQQEPPNDRPERGRLWLIVAIVLTLHAALLGSVVLMQGCGKNQPASMAESTPPQETMASSEAIPSEASIPGIPTPFPNTDLLTPEENLDGPEIAQFGAAMPAPVIEPQPSAEASPTMEKSSSIAPAQAPAAIKYTVRKGDALGKIARKYSVSIQELAAANKLNLKTPLKVGQKLVIPSAKSVEVAQGERPAASSKPSVSSNVAVRKTHQVKSKETLTSIARRYKVSVQDLLRANHISDPKKIRVNQKLLIPVATTVREEPEATSASSPGWERPSEIRPASLPENSNSVGGNGISKI